MRKICVVTGSRAEYGHLYWVMKEIQADPDLELQVVVTGMHLSPEFGLTYREIEKEFIISKKIEMLLSSDTSIGVSKSMGLAQISFAEAYDGLSPDIIVVLGDRYEILSAVCAALIARIPVAHIHGGEITEGAFDDAIRHAITKMSHLHFVTTSEYQRRVVQLGEDPASVFNFGAPSLDFINRLDLLTMSEFEESIEFKMGRRNLLVSFHPVTLEDSTAKIQFQQLLDALDSMHDTHFIFTKTNSDTGGRIINRMIDEYVAATPGKSVRFTSLGQLRYLSALQFVDVVVGNSSSGLIEAPSFKVATINIGERQKGRVRAKSVIDCEPTQASILAAFSKAFSPAFKDILQGVHNPYGVGGASKKIASTLKEFPINSIIKKKFFNINYCEVL